MPLLLGLLFLYIYITFPITALDEPVPELQLGSNEDRILKIDDEKLVKHLYNSCDVAAGYFAVRRAFITALLMGDWGFFEVAAGWKRILWALISVVGSCFYGKLLFLWLAVVSVVGSCFCHKLSFLWWALVSVEDMN